jgi:hypothetical protein
MCRTSRRHRRLVMTCPFSLGHAQRRGPPLVAALDCPSRGDGATGRGAEAPHPAAVVSQELITTPLSREPTEPRARSALHHRRSSSCLSEPLWVLPSCSPSLRSTARLHLPLAGAGGDGVTAPPTHPGPTRMRPEPTTAQGLGSIALRIVAGPTIGQVSGCTGAHTTVGPSEGAPIGRRLLVASTGLVLGCPDHALGRSTDRQCGPLVQEIAPGSGGASRSETPSTGSRYRFRVHQSPVGAAAGLVRNEDPGHPALMTGVPPHQHGGWIDIRDPRPGVRARRAVAASGTRSRAVGAIKGRTQRKAPCNLGIARCPFAHDGPGDTPPRHKANAQREGPFLSSLRPLGRRCRRSWWMWLSACSRGRLSLADGRGRSD